MAKSTYLFLTSLTSCSKAAIALSFCADMLATEIRVIVAAERERLVLGAMIGSAAHANNRRILVETRGSWCATKHPGWCATIYRW